MLRSALNLVIAAASAVLLLAGSSLSFANEPGVTRIQAPRCGGIAGLTCPRGLVCRMNGDPYPDQMGVCVEPSRGCTREYRPVCGMNGQTYSNSCLAERAGVRIRHQGACRARPDAGDEGARCGGVAGRSCDRGLYCYMSEEQADREDGVGVCRSRPQVCTREYRPVCGTDGRTYGNACGAASAGVNVDYQGQCRDRPGPRPGACTREYRPVCGVNGQTYPNACEAGRAGVRIEHQGQCRERPEVCTREYRPVCGVNGRTYPNACEADRAGVRVDHPGECRDRPRPPRPEVCPNIYVPVCGEDGVTYPSACEAARAGADVRYQGQCRR